MNQRNQTPCSPAAQAAAGDPERRQPLKAAVVEPIDLMGLRPFDVQASIEAVRKYFAPAKI